MEPLLATKLFIPSPRPELVSRPRLIGRLNEGLHGKLTLISAPAGFGKTTLVSSWIYDLRLTIDDLQAKTTSPAKIVNPKSEIVNRVAWLSLDEADNDLARFLTYLIAALQTISANIGAGLSGMLQTPQPPPTESILTALVNEITTVPDNFILVLDDYHMMDAKPVDRALTFLLEHQPPQMHLVIATREDPDLPLARLRAQSQLNELRVTDLRFTPFEAAEFLNQVMDLNLSADDIAALEARTEGWIAGLQLAGLALQGTLATQGYKDATSFIKSFTGSHHFVMDYLVEEVLHQQPENVQTFLLRTSILNRLCGPLCDAVLLDPAGSAPGQQTLEYLERANLFLISLDNERRWYRYHHLFADLLRQRLHQSFAAMTGGDAESRLNELHIRASQWYEDNGLELEAFLHAAAADDIDRAERLVEGKTIPLHLRGAIAPILDWLASLPAPVMNARPSLWWRHASLLLINGQTIGVAEKLQAAEAALAALGLGPEADDHTRNLIGQIATARSTLALTRYDVETMLAQSRRALEYLHPDNMFTRATAHWTMGYAYILLGDRAAARRALTESISLSQRSGAIFAAILAALGLGLVQEGDNQLHQAAETYRRVLEWAGDHPQQIIHEAHLGLGRISYEWNDLDVAEQHAEQSLQLAQQYEQVIDRSIICEVFLARLKLARGDVAEAAAILARADRSVRQHHFVHRIPEVATAQVLTLLRQGDVVAAAHLAQAHNLPLSQARVHLAQGDPAAALAVLETWRRQAETKGWEDERLKTMVLQAKALHAHGKKSKAMQMLDEALALAEPEGFIRIFVDEGAPMAELLKRMKTEGGRMTVYIDTLLSAFEKQEVAHPSREAFIPQPLVEPLSQRELEVLQLIAEGLSNDEIGRQLFLALDTVKGHNRKIFDKLQVQRRTEAVARARELGLL